jgi:hypothetical protein
MMSDAIDVVEGGKGKEVANEAHLDEVAASWRLIPDGR